MSMKESWRRRQYVHCSVFVQNRVCASYRTIRKYDSAHGVVLGSILCCAIELIVDFG